MDITRMVYLFKRYFDKTATNDQREELMTWISQDENTHKTRGLMDQAWKEFNDQEPVFTEKKSEEILRNILQKDLTAASTQRRYPRSIHPNWLRTAAAITLFALAGTGGYLWYSSQDPNANLTYHGTTTKPDVAPGGNKAILTLANGATVILNSTQNGAVAEEGNTKVIKLKSGQLVYKTKNSKSNAERPISFNSLSVPRGGQYQITLPDGSKVWLNAASSLKYPTAFNGKERKVELTGEGYFEISQNKERPFFVEVPAHQKGVGDMTVEVLGTHFNVNAYTDESFIKTTLVNGAVRIVRGKDSELLQPGQQANIENGTNKITVTTADLEEATAWKDGIFHFDDEDMASIMRKLARWYDIDVTYQGAIPTGHYTGIISRNTNLSEVLKVLELSGVLFKMDGKNIVVM